MATERVTQTNVEIGSTIDDKPARVTQTAVEVASTQDAKTARVTQSMIEVGYLFPRRRRVIVTGDGV